MTRKTGKEKWRTAYGMARATKHADDYPCKVHPRFAGAAEYAMCSYDSWSWRKPGRFLVDLRRKQRVIESGGYWLGFNSRFSNLNCRCSMVSL